MSVYDETGMYGLDNCRKYILGQSGWEVDIVEDAMIKAYQKAREYPEGLDELDLGDGPLSSVTDEDIARAFGESDPDFMNKSMLESELQQTLEKSLEIAQDQALTKIVKQTLDQYPDQQFEQQPHQYPGTHAPSNFSTSSSTPSPANSPTPSPVTPPDSFSNTFPTLWPAGNQGQTSPFSSFNPKKKKVPKLPPNPHPPPT